MLTTELYSLDLLYPLGSDGFAWRSSDSAKNRTFRMTVIGAMICRDYLLLAADSVVREESVSLVRPQVKLASVDGLPLAWGCSGNVDSGRRFSEWLASVAATPVTSDWSYLSEAATRTLSELNGFRRRMAKVAHAKPNREHVTDVLLVGYLRGKPGILEIDADGGQAFAGDEAFMAVGSARERARMVFEVLRKERGNFECNETTLRNIMEWAISFTAGCGGPVQMLRITRDGVEER